MEWGLIQYQCRGLSRQPALDINKSSHAVSDEDFMKLVAILRLAIPYTGIILSTRESSELRNRLFHIGASQISTNSKTYPGGYAAGDEESASKGQFSIGDKRTTCEVIKHISNDGFAPSFALPAIEPAGQDRSLWSSQSRERYRNSACPIQS